MAAVDIAAWLRELGLERYEQAFRANDIDADVLPELSEADLEKLGVSLGHRKKLLKAIADLHASDGGRAGPAPATPPGAAPGVEGERRQVAVLFADLSGYTELSRQLDAEEVHGLLERFFDRVDSTVDQFGGSVDKHIGDCVMAVFGAPTADGNDAERAARAALAVSRETGIRFHGPNVLGGLARTAEDPNERRRALAEGEAIIRQGAVAHNHLRFYPEAIETALELTDWEEAERYADALEAFTRPEPLPWSDFFIGRGRVLAALGRGWRDDGSRLELERLCAEARRLELLTALPALEQSLAEV